MQKTNAQYVTIAAFWNAKKSDPQAVIDAMIKYGVDAAEVAFATGESYSTIQTYLYKAGVPSGFGGLPAKSTGISASLLFGVAVAAIYFLRGR